jgi:chromosome partitioning protein
MQAKIIAVVNQKGGAGKTTVAMQLAGTLGRRGYKVLVVDADPQATSSRWAASADDSKPFPATVVGLSAAQGKLHREVKKLMADYDYIVIDGPPAADSPIAQSALMIADLALVPVIPSPLDIWASVGIRKAIEDAAEINENLKSRLVVNQCQPNTSLTKDILDLLPEFGITMAQSQFHQRTVYRQSAVFGQTVQDFGAKALLAISEVEMLCDEVLDMLNRKSSRKQS